VIQPARTRGWCGGGNLRALAFANLADAEWERAEILVDEGCAIVGTNGLERLPMLVRAVASSHATTGQVDQARGYVGEAATELATLRGAKGSPAGSAS